MKHIKIFLYSVIVLITTAVLTYKLYYNNALPNYNGEKVLPGLSDTTTVLTNEFGIPYILAENNRDLFFTAGYILARERLFQMSILSSVVNGDLSGLFGERYHKHDQFIKANNELVTEEQINSMLKPAYKEIIKAYCDGINAYIEEKKGLFPESFKITNSKPKKWTVMDAVNTLIMSTTIHKKSSESREFILKEINQYFGGTRYDELISVNIDTSNGGLSLKEIQIEDEIVSLIGAKGTVGSATLIIPPSKTISSKPIFIFDDIWGYQQPTKWYNVYLQSDELTLEGAILTGFPLPIVGNTGKLVYAIQEVGSLAMINNLFDMVFEEQERSTTAPIYYADTLGNYFSASDNNNHLSVLQYYLKDTTDIKVSDIINRLSCDINLNKRDFIKSIFEDYAKKLDSINFIKNVLIDWDGDESQESKSALLVNTIYKNLLKEIFYDELSLISDDIYNIFIKNTKFVDESIKKIVKNNKSDWLDNINTIDYKENLADVLKNTVKKSILELKSEYGNEFLLWGKVNQKSFEHILSEIKSTNKLKRFNVGPIPRYGSFSGINVNEFIYNEKLTLVSTVALRKIYDLSDLATSYFILPTGQSGLYNSPHYSDQLRPYLEHKLLKLDIGTKTTAENSYQNKLIFYPAE